MADLSITPRENLAIVSAMARKGADAAAIGAVLGATLPDRPAAVFAGRRTIVGTGPGTWLVIEEGGAPDLADTLAEALTGLASISDQSSGYLIQRIAGASARTLLQRGAAIDVHPDAFGPGSAATTVIAHIGVIFWQVDDAPSYDIATFRSYAASFRHWLDVTTAAL